MPTFEEQLAAARARGAVIINDAEPGRGFDEEPLVADLGPKLEREVDEAGDRARNAKQHAGVAELAEEAHEGNVNAVRKYRFDHQQDFTEEAWTPGRIMWIGAFLCELQKVRPDAFYAEVAIRGLRGLGFMQNGLPVYSGTAYPNGNAPEWSQLRVDARGLPTNEKYRGWRTVLLQCIKGKFITVEQCYRVFGRPSGARSRPWYRTLWAIQHGSCMECGQTTCECKGRWDYLRADNYAYETPAEIIKGKRQQMDAEPCRIIAP